MFGLNAERKHMIRTRWKFALALLTLGASLTAAGAGHLVSSRFRMSTKIVFLGYNVKTILA
jgi:hypothetical protein